jgi:hypothetical protein
MRLLLFTAFLFTPFGLVSRMQKSNYANHSEKFIRQGWILKDGDL